MAPHTVIPRFVLALKGYLILHRTWHCAWAMAARPYSPATTMRPLPDLHGDTPSRFRSRASNLPRLVD